MIVECGHCGAPLDIGNRRGGITKCNYCGVQNERVRLRTIAEFNPPDFKPPKVWTPPSNAAASSDKALAYKKSRTPFWVYVVVMIPFMPPIILLFMEYAWPHFYGTTPDAIAAQPLDRNVDQMESDLAATRRFGNDVHTRFRRGTAATYAEFEFSYSAEDRALPHELKLKAELKSKLPEALVPALNKNLHGGLNKDGYWRFGPIEVRVDLSDGDVWVTVDSKAATDHPNPFRKRQLEVGRQLLLNAAFGTPMRVSQQEIVEVFGGGYPTAQLGKLDPTTPLEAMAATVKKLFPGAMPESPTDFRIAIDHPLLYSIRLSWTNEAGGVLSNITLDETESYPARRRAMVTCLSAQLGPPKEDVSDYAKKKTDYTFSAGPAENPTELSLNETGIQLRVASRRRARPGDADTVGFSKIFAALDKCR